MFFSKKPYEVFLEFGGYGQSDIIIRKSKSQELRKLVKRAHMVQESTQNKDGEDSNVKLSGAKKPLMRFLRSLAKEAYAA